MFETLEINYIYFEIAIEILIKKLRNGKSMNMIRKYILAICLLLIIICQIVSSVEASAGYEVTDIYVNNNFLKADTLVFDIKIGDEPVFSVKYRVVIERLLFNTIAIKKVTDYTTSYGSVEPFNPGEISSFEVWGPDIILPGFYMVHVYPDPDGKIIGEGYTADCHSEKFFAIGFVFLNWFQSY